MKQFISLLPIYILMFLMHAAHAQTTLRYGAELGLAFSQFPKEESYVIISRNDKVKETTNSLYSPLVGFITELTVKKNFQLGIGLQYQMVGKRYYYHRDGNDLLHGGTYTNDTWEKQTFHKVCLPLTAGFSVKVGKWQPAIFIGYRPNFFLKGKSYSKIDFNHNDPERDIIEEFEYNPLTSEWPVRRFHNQFLAGVSTSFGQHLKLSITVNSGEDILHSKSLFSDRPYSFKNTDYVLSIAYLLNSQTN